MAGLLVAFLASNVAVGIWLATSNESSVRDISLGGLAVGQAALWFGYLGAPLVAARVKGSGRLADDFGFVAHARDVVVGVPVGLVCQLLLVPLIYAPFHVRNLEKPARDVADKAHGGEFVVLAVVLVVGAPIVEELFFRGLLLRALANRFGDRWAVVVSSLVFAGAHFEAVQFVGLFAVGVVFAVVALRAGRLGPAIFAHGVFNAVVVAVLIAQRA